MLIAAKKNSKLGVRADKTGGQLLIVPKLENKPLSI
jgi:hypothetical protein